MHTCVHTVQYTCACTHHRAAVIVHGSENELAVNEKQLKDGDLGVPAYPDVDCEPQRGVCTARSLAKKQPVLCNELGGKKQLQLVRNFCLLKDFFLFCQLMAVQMYLLLWCPLQFEDSWLDCES